MIKDVIMRFGGKGMFNAKITGLDRLQRQFEDAQRALESLNGTITTVKIDPNDPASVQRAIHQMETTVDNKVARYGDNPLVAQVAAKSKAHFRERLLKRARGEQ
jgi:hypothetical protein